MIKRIISMFAALAVAFLVLADSAPVANAIVPVGLVQSAMASYVASTGYKLYNDNGTANDLMGALSQLYDTFLSSPTGTAVQAFTEAHIAAIEGVYLDHHGNIVVKKMVADVFQQFCDWIKEEYDVREGETTPTTLISGDPTWTDGNGIRAVRITTPEQSKVSGVYVSTQSFGTQISDHNFNLYLGCNNALGDCLLTAYDNENTVSVYALSKSGSRRYTIPIMRASDKYINGYVTSNVVVGNAWVKLADVQKQYYTLNLPVSSVIPQSTNVTEGVAAGLAATIAAGVLDIAQTVKENEAVVIGVGAEAGASAADVEEIVKTGIKARDLVTDVTVTAEDVIDTPAQPYPDVESLGLPSLGAALISRFPFCIPWDFVDTIRLLSAEPQAPYFQFDLIPQRVKNYVGISGGTTITVDLSRQEYSKIGEICRWGSLIGFCFGLALLTKRMIWTA